MAKTFGYGCVLQVTTTTGDLAIGQIRSINGPNSQFGDVDTTCIDSSSNFRTFIPGLGDPGEITLAVAYDSTSRAHAVLSYYHKNRSSKAFKLYHGTTDAAENAFTAYVKGYSRSIPMDDVITADITLKVSGLPGLTT